MLHNYLTVALRTLWRNKTFSAINILGLAISIATCLLLVLFITDELQFDQYHTKKARIYRLTGNYDQGGDENKASALTNFGLAPLLKNEFPFIQNIVRINFGEAVVKQGTATYLEKKVCYADSGFFDMFSYRFIHGNPRMALQEPNTVVVTQATARKYFGQENAVGKTMQLSNQVVKITGVIEEVPQNSHFHFDLAVSVKTVERDYEGWMRDPRSGGAIHYTYLLLPENYQPQQLQTQLGGFVKKYIGQNSSATLHLQPLTHIHLRSNLSSEIEPNGSLTYVYIFAVVAVIILLIACVNYMSLTTARAADRAKEVGLRKVIGARQEQLIFQFLGESVVISAVAFFIAGLLAVLALPWLNRLSGKELSLSFLASPGIWLGLAAFSVGIGLVAGIYPAFFLSAFRLTHVLKGSSVKVRGFSLRKGLVVLQFSASIVLVIATLLIYQQWQYIQTKKLGINTQHVLTIPLSTERVTEHYQAMKTILLTNPNIVSVAAAGNELTTGVTNWRQYKTIDSKTAAEFNIPTMDVDVDFFKTLQAEVVAGRGFSKDFPSDVQDAFLVNESAAKFLNLTDPVDKYLRGTQFNGKEGSLKKGRIIGVVEDFHFASLHTEIKPVVFNLHSEKASPLLRMWVRVKGDNIPATLSYLQNTWKQFENEYPLQYSFLDEDIEKLYGAEQRFLRVFITFSGLAIFIACLGLFGLVTFTARQRTKEIGVRKVLGASVVSIVALLSRDFLKLVLLANVIAWPLAGWAMYQWLQDFAYRTPISWGLFALAGGLALLIALVTISFQAIKAALTNPVDALRSE